MSEPKKDADVAFIRALTEMVRENDLAELEVKRETEEAGRLSVRVSRGGSVAHAIPAAVQAAHAPAHAAVVPPAAPPPPQTPAGESAAAAQESDPASHPGAVTSPMVGTVYLQAEPGSDPFVRVGDKVAEGQTLLIVEAMKTMNQIPSPNSGTVSRILVEDGAPVEFGAVLMIVE